MRKTLIIFAVLLITGISVIIYAHVSLTAAQDNVSFTETMSYGGIAAANGLTVRVQSQLMRHLLWDTAHTFSQDDGAQTDFSFSSSNLTWPQGYNGEVISVGLASLDQSASTSGGNLLDTSDGRFTRSWDILLIREVLLNVASRTQNGRTHSETINFRDYYEYYPLGVHFNFYNPEKYYFTNGQAVGQAAPDSDVQAAFSKYFKIPVPEKHMVTVGITKDSRGNVVGYSISRTDNVYLYSISAESADGVYFALSSEGMSDYSGITGGFGIYLLPASTIEDGGGKQLPTLDYNNLQTVYNLDESARVLRLNLSEDKSCLNLITAEEGKLYLTVIDRASMSEKQKLPLFEGAQGADLMTVEYFGGLLFVMLGDNRFMLLELSGGNNYRAVLTGTRENKLPIEMGYGRWHEPEIAWDGERLALISPNWRHFSSDGENVLGYLQDACGFVLEVFGESGLLYQGAFESSLDVLAVSDNYHGLCRRIDTGGLSANWEL